ncbi:MAG: HlyD family efflux transporter periplasmic adaptor subunit [Clostridia bacterium]|nr:HlyD family efflux transporter periplasmic adaptor subunit [Clostridia bacterium]
MKKRWGWVVFLLTALLSMSAQADQMLSGRVVPSDTVSMQAPFGGVVKRAELRAGTRIQIGSPVAEMAVTKVMASEDGVVTGIFAEPGDSAEQTVLYLAPVSRFTVSATVSKAYSSPETKYVLPGETVYIKCAKDGSHKAVGTITAVDGSAYTVETTAGELYMEETVYIYRSPTYLSKTCIGSGTVSRTDVLSVSGTGSLIRMCVEDGEEVERGQTLFETVEGDIDALLALEPTLRSTVSGIVAEVTASAGQKVSKGDTLFTVYPDNSLMVEFDIPQASLSSVSPGDSVQLYFDWQEQKVPVSGVVTDISYMAHENAEGDPVYYGYLTFENDSWVREGMNVYVQIQTEVEP